MSGYQYISSGGRAHGTIVSSGGWQVVNAGGIVFDTTVNYGGSTQIAGSNTVLGGTTSAGGSLLTGSYATNLNGGKLVYDLANRAPINAIIVDNLANLSNGTFGISISRFNECGIYQLAGGATAFSGNVALSIDGVAAGSLTLSSSLVINGTTYALSKAGDNLILNVTNPDAVNWPYSWMGVWDIDAPSTAKAVATNGMIDATHLVRGNVYAARTEPGKSYTSIAVDSSLANASCFARISGGNIGTFRGGDHKNYIYMTGGTVTTFYAGDGASAGNLVQIDGGTVGTFYGGGEFGVSSASSTIMDGTFNTIYGGGAKGETTYVRLYISGGTINRVRCGADAGASVGYGDIYATITGGTITGQIVGGGLGDAGSVTLEIAIDSPNPTGAYIYGGSIGGDVESVYLTISKGKYQGIIVGGSRASGSGVSVANSGMVAVTITGEGTAHISNPLAIAAGVDTAWIFTGQAVSGGTYTAGWLSILAITSGASVKYAVGGAAADGAGSMASVGNVILEVYDATVTGGIWGAGYAYNGGKASAYDVTIYISGESSISSNIYTGGIVLGSSGTVSYDRGTVEFNGSGDYLDFSKTVDGSGSTYGSKLVFNGYTGGFNGTITNFERVVLTGDASVDIRNAYTDCTELVFDLSERTTEEMFITSMDSIQFGAGTNYIGLVLPTAISGEIYTALMGVSDLGSIEGVTLGLLNSYSDITFYDTFELGEVYAGDGFELVVDYESGVLYSWISAT